MARADSSASSAHADQARPAAVLKKPADAVRGNRDEARHSSSGTGANLARSAPAAESHAGLSASLHESFGNTLIQSALGGSLEGPAPLISAALTMGAAGLGPESAQSGALSNSGVAAYLAARDALPAPEIFARDADSRVKAAAARGGKPLPELARNRLEAAFGGVDFSGVRLHADGAANQASRAINAKAYTVGQHIYLGHGYDNLQDRGNLRLLLHELTHVVQHLEGRLRASAGANQTEGGMAVSSPTDAVELEAENMATSLLPGLDGSILVPMDAELAVGQGMELGTQSAEVGEQGAADAGQAAMRSRDDDNSALDKQAQGAEQNQDEVDGRTNDQEALEALGEWKSSMKAQAEKMEALGERISMWDSLEEAERKTLWRETLAAVLVLSRVALKAISATLESSDAGLKLGAKLQAVGSLLSLVGWALGDAGPSTGEVQDERTKENKDSKDPSEPRFTAIVGWVEETIGGDAGVDFGAQTLGKVLEGARKLQDAMGAFLEGIEAMTSGVNDLKQVKDQKEGQAAKDSKKLDSKQLQKTLAKLSERSEALNAKLSGDAGAEQTTDAEAETGPTQDQAATDVADTELEDAALNGLETAAVKAHGAALQNAPKKLQKHWTGQLEAGTNLGVEKPMRRWTKVKVLDGAQKGAWGYVDRHFFKGRNKEPGRAATKEKRLTRPTRETLHRNASGPMGRNAASERPTGGGQALPGSLKEAFRPILGRSIDSVRIHTDSAAAEFAIGVAANAVTVGRDIYFAPGTFSESGDTAKTLIAEELHHAVLGGGKPGVSQPGDDHERKARAFAHGAVSGGLLEVIDATFGETLTPAKAQGRKHHPRRALQTLKGAVPTKMLRQLGDALGTSQGSGLQPGAPGVGLRHMGVGGTPKRMRPPKKVTPAATPTPDKSVANRNAAVDTKRRAQMEKVFGEYENMSFAVSLTTDKGRKATVKITGVETPYRINGSNVERSRGDHRSKDRRRIPKGKAGAMAAMGKASPSQVQTAIQGAIKAGTISFTKVPDKWLNAAGNKLTSAGAEGVKAKIRSGLQYKAKRGSANLLGVDCSGFTYQIILRLAQAEGHTGGEWGTTPLNVGTGTMKTAKNMRTITAPGEMRTADLMLFGGHVEAIYSITAINAATWKKEGTGNPFPKNGGVWKIITMESSPDGAQREGTQKSTWYAMETVTQRAGKKATSKVQFWKNKGERNWHSPTVKVRRAKLLEETEEAANAGSDGAGLSEVKLRGSISRNARGPIARNAGVPLPQGGGQALPAKVIEQLSGVFGKGLGAVRIHTGKQAQAASEGIAANAFTAGTDIFFNKGMFNPQNEKGLALLAEELHHALVGGGGPGISQPGDAHEKAAGSFVEQLLNPNKDDPSIDGGASGSPGLSRQAQSGATASVAPDLSGYSDEQLRQLVYGANGSQRYQARGPGWQAVDAGGVTLEMFKAAREALQSRGALGQVHSEGMDQGVYNTYGQNAVATGMHGRNQDNGGANLGGNFAATQGTPPAPLPQAQPGSARITDYRTAKDGRRYAIATGADGKNVVIWGGKDTSDAELRTRADARLPEVPGVAEEPKTPSLWDRTEKETVLLQATGSATFVDESVVGDSWHNAETIGGGTTSGSYDVLGVEAGGDSKAEITTDGAKAHAAVTAKAQLVAWKQKWEWETPPLSILGEDFTATFFVSVDAFVGAEARAQITAQIEKSKGGRTIPGDEILAGMDTQTTQTADGGTQTTATGPTAAVDASAGVFAGAKLRLGAGLAGNWVKKPQSAYERKVSDNIGSMIDGIAASVPGLGWVVKKVGADQIVKSLLEKVLTWGAAGATPILGVEGTAEGSLGVGAQVAAKVGFKGGKFSMEFGANATWGVGLGAKVSVTIDAIEGVKLALVVGGELYKYARDWVSEKAADFSGWASGVWDSIMGWFSADDKVREMVANDVHKCVDASKRAEMLRTLMGGWTGGDDEQAMMSILRYSKAAGDLGQVTAIVSKSELRGELGSMVNSIIGSPPRRRGRRRGRSRNAAGLAPRNGMALPAPRGGGQALPAEVYSKLVPMFGTALNEIKIHTGTEAQGFAQGLNANAVTQGTDIFFNKATFDPGSTKGMELLLEEVHHAVVGGGGPGVSKPGDAHERDAKGMATRLVGGGLLDTIDALLTQGAGEGTESEQTQADPRQILGQLGGNLPPAIQARLRQQLGLEGGDSQISAQGTQGASRQEQASGPSVTPTAAAPDLSGASAQALRAMVFTDSGAQRYRRSAGTWAPVEPGGVNLATFIAAREQLMSQSGMGGVTHGGRNQALFNTYSQNTRGVGGHADNAETGAVNLGGAFIGTSARPTSGRDHIQDFRTARDGRRYAVATGADGRNVVVWGARGSTDEEMRERADRQLAGVHGERQRDNLWDRTGREVQLYGQTSHNVLADTSVAGEAWSNAEGMGGSTTSGSYDVLGFEAGAKTRLEATTDGVELEAAVEARGQLFEWKQKWEWETEQYTLLGESFSGTFFVSVDAFVGAEAKARIMGSIQRSQGSRTVDGDAILSEMDTQTSENANGTTETVGTGPSGPSTGGPSAGIDASAGAFAGAKVRLGAGMAANWHKKDQGAYSTQMQNTIKAGIDTASSAVPGLGWVMRQVGADTVVERLISSVLTWGPQGKVPVLGIEGTGEGSLGVGAQIAAKVGFSGGKLSFTWGANVTWGVGLGAKVSVNIDALEGIKLALIVGGELVSIATDWISDAVSDMAGFGASLWESFWGLFSGDDKVREAVANDAHKLADAAQRGEMLKKLMSGWTGGDDQEAMIQILRFSHSNGDLNAVLAVADKGDVRGELDGDRKNEFKRMVGE